MWHFLEGPARPNRRNASISLLSKRAFTLLPILILILCGGCRAAPGERAISRAEFGEAWPLTVDGGVIACVDGSSVVFRADGLTYTINGTARGQAAARGYRDIAPIQRLKPVATATARADRLSEADRQAIFAEVVQCQLNGSHYTGAAAVGWAEACRTQVARAQQLTGDEVSLIMTEGASVGWPPVKPVRASIRPIFDVGLELCRR